MTIKKYQEESSVWNALERTAVNQGIVTPSISDIVKRASKPAYTPTGDLYNDMFRLAAGLRDKGFVKEADSLEEKIFLQKKAGKGTHLYRVFDEDGEDLLDFAHPGDVKVSDAQNGLGMVETLQSAHNKIVDVVAKKPTGKLAAQNVLKMVSAALQEPLKKKAEPEEEETVEEFIKGDRQERLGKIAKINKHISDNWVLTSNSLGAAISILEDPNLQFKSSKEIFNAWFGGNLKLVNLFAEKAGIDMNGLSAWFDTLKEVYGDINVAEQFVPQLIEQRIFQVKSNNYQSLVELGNKVKSGLGQTFFVGSSDAKSEPASKRLEQAKNPLFAQNPNSIWVAGTSDYTYFVQDANKRAAAAKALHDEMAARWAGLVKNKLADANAKLKESLAQPITNLKTIQAYFAAPPQLQSKAQDKDLAEIISGLKPQVDTIAIYSPATDRHGGGSEIGNQLSEMIHAFGLSSDSFNGNMAKANEYIGKSLQFFAQNHLGPLDYIVLDNKAETLFRQVASQWKDALSKIDEKQNPKKFADYKKMLTVALNAANSAKKSLNGPYANLLNDLRSKNLFNEGEDISSYEKLLAEGEKFLADTTAFLAKNAAEINKLTKEAVSMPGQVAAKPTGQSKGPGNAKNSSVQNLQKELIKFGEFLKKDPKYLNYYVAFLLPKFGADGVWGEETKMALQYLQAFIADVWDKQHPKDPVQNKVILEASGTETNLKAVQEVHQKMLGGGGASATVDVVPKTLTNENITSAERDGFQVTWAAINSVPGFYEFISIHYKPHDSLGISYAQMLSYLNWFKNRATHKYRTEQSEVNSRYYAKMDRLIQDFYRFAKSRNLDQTPNEPITYDMLNSAGGGGGGFAQTQRPGSGGEIDEGVQVGGAGQSKAPFSRGVLNVKNNEEYFPRVQALGVNHNLFFSEFRNNAALNDYGEQKSPILAQKRALVEGGWAEGHNARFDANAKEYYVSDGNRWLSFSEALRDPRFKKLQQDYQRASSADASYSFKDFLRALSADVNEAFNKYVNDEDTHDQEAKLATRERNKWNTLIAKKMME